jgi:hypothetical protein
MERRVREAREGFEAGAQAARNGEPFSEAPTIELEEP